MCAKVSGKNSINSKSGKVSSLLKRTNKFSNNITCFTKVSCKNQVF